MGWGQVFAGLAWNVTKTGVKTSVNTGKHISKKITEFQKKNKLQEENRLNRKVLVEKELLQRGWFGQVERTNRMLLEKETIPVERQTVLPENVHKSFRNTIISGGSSKVRAQAMIRTCEDAYLNGLPFIIIHCSNKEIEQGIMNSDAINENLIINADNSCYDPFLGLTPFEISSTFIQSGPECIKNNWKLSVLVELIAELYTLRQNKPIPFKTLLQFNVSQVPTKILDSRNAGIIDDAKMMEMNQRYQSCQTEIWQLQQYLDQLRTDFHSFYRKHQGGYKGIGKAFLQKKAVTIDIMDKSNVAFVKILLHNLMRIKKKGVEFVICLSDITLNAYDGIIFDTLFRSNSLFSISSDDIISSAGEKYNTLFGYSEDIILFNHSDGDHSDVLSKSLGTYSRWNIGYNYSSTKKGLIPDHTQGMNLTQDPNARRIPPEIIQSLERDQMIYKDGDSNSIYILSL